MLKDIRDFKQLKLISPKRGALDWTCVLRFINYRPVKKERRSILDKRQLNLWIRLDSEPEEGGKNITES